MWLLMTYDLLDSPTGIEWTVGHFPPGSSPIGSFRSPAVYSEKWGIHLNYRSLSRVPKYDHIICKRWIAERVGCRVKFATWQQIQFFAIDFSSIHVFHTAVWTLFCECGASDKNRYTRSETKLIHLAIIYPNSWGVLLINDDLRLYFLISSKRQKIPICVGPIFWFVCIDKGGGGGSYELEKQFSA